MRRLDLLLTPGFLAALLLLVLNDQLFKTLWPGLLTGKVSDLAGLYAVIVFAAAWRPRHAVAIAWITALAFIAWKSPLADPLIASWNDLEIWPVARVVDYTDLAAIAIVPLAVRAVRAAIARPPIPSSTRLVAQCAIALVAAAAFAATTRFFVVELETTPRYLVSRSCAELSPQLASNYLAPPEEEQDIDKARVRIGSVLSNGAPVHALVELRSSGENCMLTLLEFSSTNDSRIEKKDVQGKAVLAFEERVLGALEAAYEKQSP